MITDLSVEDKKKISEVFLKELLASSSGKKTSLQFIKNTVPESEKQKKYQAMVFGGTVFEKALVEKKNNEYILSEFHKSQLPILETKEIFLNFFKSHIDKTVDTITVSFAYPLLPVYENDRLDGLLLRNTKDHTFTGLVGEKVGFELEKYSEKTLHKKIRVTIANDTVCLVLSGKDIADSENVVGGIVGTGVNFGFFLDKKTIVNLESGNFNNFSISKATKYIDSYSNNPGQQLFEKEVAGGYLYKLFSYYTHQTISSSNEVSVIAALGGQKGAIAQLLLRRSAGLIACQLAAIYKFKKQEKLYCVMEGTLFWEGYRYIEWTRESLEELGVKEDQIEFIKIEKSSLKGAAHLL